MIRRREEARSASCREIHISLGVIPSRDVDTCLAGYDNSDTTSPYRDFRYSVRSSFSAAVRLRFFSWSYLATTSARVGAEPSWK